MLRYSLSIRLLSSIHHIFPSSFTNFAPQNFAPALIMLRVVLRRSQPDTEWSAKVSGLQFNSASGAQESAGSRGATSTMLTVPRSHREGEVNLEVNGELGTESLPVGENEMMARV